MSNGFGEDSQIEKASGRSLMDHQPPSVTEKLEQEKHELELRLQAITEVLDQLEQNPATAKIIDNLSKLGRGMF